MGKLVRDRIPDIIRASGGEPVTVMLDDDAYAAALREKLREECGELAAAPPEQLLEEAADVLEVVLALTETRAHGLADVLRARDAKRAERGGFEQRIWLEGRA